MGIEWDIAAARPEERAELAWWVELHKEMRPLHTGTTVRADRLDPAVWLHGDLAPDRTEPVVAMATGVHPSAGRVQLPGLYPTGPSAYVPWPPSRGPWPWRCGWPTRGRAARPGAR